MRGPWKDGCTQLTPHTHTSRALTPGPHGCRARAGTLACLRRATPSRLSPPAVTHVGSLDDEVPQLPVPQHAEHVLLLALALPHQEVPAAAQQLLHLQAWDGPVVPDLLAQRLLHLRDEGHGGRQLDGDGGEPSRAPGSSGGGGIRGARQGGAEPGGAGARRGGG